MAEPITIGAVTLPNRVFLAPMSGVTDRPFREIAWRHGAGMVVSEMVASESIATADPEATLRAERAGKGPHVIQLAGREQHWMAEGARAATDAGADIIDINMGCPAKKVTSGYSGSALMRDLDHAVRLVEATVGATKLPVTLKMRLGWDDGTRNAPELARRAAASGIQMITVHGRTRCQFYSGKADWAAIRAVKDAVDVPIVANGDLVEPKQLREMLALSGADAVMIGRGAYGRPWHPGDVVTFARTGRTATAPSAAERLELVQHHYLGLLDHYGPEVGLRAARKHLGWYLDRYAAAETRASLRHPILTERHPDRVLSLLQAAFGSFDRARAA